MQLTDEQLTRRENSIMKELIKVIPEDKIVHIEAYSYKHLFEKKADIIFDDERKENGDKKRQTGIRLANHDESVIQEKKEWIYIFTINGYIVKIGGTRSGLKQRFGSYLCGYHTRENGKSGKNSVTNGYIYNTLLFYLEAGYPIELYGYELPIEEIVRPILGNDGKIRVQTYHAYESALIDHFKCEYGFIPFLCDNSDPDYKTKNKKEKNATTDACTATSTTDNKS